MLRINKISTKIKILGGLLIFLMLSVISITIYLNEQNKHDAFIINIAGKERMLSQKITKNIFYIFHNKNESLDELRDAAKEFATNLDALKNGSSQRGIIKATQPQIINQLGALSDEWNTFFKLVSEFEDTYLIDDTKTKKIVDKIYAKNITFLNSIDNLVTMYTNHSETKTEFIRTFQYLSAFIMLLVFTYSLLKLKSIESNVDAFMHYSKMLTQSKDLADITPIQLGEENEDELVEVGGALNSFIQKVSLAVECSNEALKQSQEASGKLEELAGEFDSILYELNDKTKSQKHLSNSEDMVIESSENLILSTKKLSKLKQELEELIASCKNIN